ncbi:MAG: hypothetical protein HQK76_14935 [Desulfobacterales bacterium]|nr:hypothetical protein [Desulfobacterales bacterium]
MNKLRIIFNILIILCIQSKYIEAGSLIWPIDCIPGQNCDIGYPDIDGDGKAFNCGPPGYTRLYSGYTGHQEQIIHTTSTTTSTSTTTTLPSLKKGAPWLLLID